MIGKLLDHRYQIIRVLAQGGFGQTYIAQDTRRPGNPVCVVKHLKPATSDPRVFDTAKRLFNSEAETLESLGHHDQIPRLLAYFDENQEFYLVQEFIPGQTLAEELIPGQRWSESQVMQLLQGVLEILEFVHGQGVIHRDIKPDNIIRRACDQKLVLVDFGAVKQLRLPMVTVGGQPTATVAIGTPGYMPTEQGQGKPRPNSDIYSLGIIAIQALTGVPAIELQEDPNTGELLWEHLANVNYRLAGLLTKMVHYHFKDRYQSVTEALQACINTNNPVLTFAKPPVSSQNHHYQPSKSLSQVSPQKTVAVAPANPIAAQPAREQSHKLDPWPFLIGLFLASGAAALATNVYPQVRNLTANFTGNDTAANNCLAVVAGNSNVRSEPSSINSDTVLQKIGDNTGFEVTGKRTKRGWVEVKMNSGRLAWAHLDVITNNEQWVSCLRDKGVAINTVDDRNLITALPIPQPKPQPTPEPAETPKESESSDESEKIIAEAKQKYESGDLRGAIALLRSIPGHASSGFRETVTMINQWQKDWAKAEELFNDINQAIDNGEWEKVLDYKNHAEKLPDTQYWRNKIQPLLQQVDENVSKQASPAVDNQHQSQPEIPNAEEASATEEAGEQGAGSRGE
ncbi:MULTISPECIES: serine/threonine protein kinase [unclassified Nodularia (in: cyanobacteria)]|uniref:serine/threonine protein kinase n=1 Tax=unclassified Nodularia (in: cyanobacteria) TaxID=2656917 RepID=UPI00187FE171|nr:MULTISPECIES: serine/threonine protein kinase [unclassified Nodularia (in: cyanobacteria)]MBE9200115.1 protein kinase [Nodularia sp. LEGE 06071]MCC2693995.1 protein kinase [Nodularia sp. LEGE 04288]